MLDGGGSQRYRDPLYSLFLPVSLSLLLTLLFCSFSNSHIKRLISHQDVAVQINKINKNRIEDKIRYEHWRRKCVWETDWVRFFIHISESDSPLVLPTWDGIGMIAIQSLIAKGDNRISVERPSCRQLWGGDEYQSQGRQEPQFHTLIWGYSVSRWGGAW